LTKIKGNVGEAVLTCRVNGEEYALETPDTVANVLTNVVGYDLSEIERVIINDDYAHFNQLVGAGDCVQVIFTEPESEEYEPEEDFYSEPVPDDEALAETVTITIDGHQVTGRPQDIKRILGC
jgi:hypothetical protein